MRFSRGISRLLVTLVTLLSPFVYAQGQGRQKFKPTDKYVPGQVIVRYKDGTTAPAIGAPVAGATMSGAKIGRSFHKVRNLHVMQLPEGVSVQQALDQLRADRNVLYAEPDYIVHTDEVVPNDPQFGTLWAMRNTGQSGGTVDADIDATDAWTLSTGSNSVIVGVIDSGVDTTHPELVGNIFSNPSDCNNDGVDDDGNGKVDDCHGWNAAYNQGSMYDDVGHGTHVSGTIGATGNNAFGVVGVNWHVTIMPCKFLVPDGTGGGSGALSDAVECLDYFATMKDLGYNIVATNNSWGGGSYSQALYDAIQENMERGILFIAAAGNGGADGVGDNNDQAPHYPSTYDLQNIIAVAATTRTDAKSSFSNYGRRTVDIGAPGSAILSTLPAGNYGIYDGTSMATPHVTGTAALLKAYNPALEWYQIRNLILAGGDVKASMVNTFTGKRLNTYGSMNCVNRPVSGRLTPDATSSVSGLGDTVLLSYLNVNCKDPAGPVNVTAVPGGTIPLHDDGSNGDPVAGDGAYSALLNTSAVGTTNVTFPGSDIVSVKALRQYQDQETASSYRTISGTNLQLSDEFAKAVTAPFPILFGGSSYPTINVGSNGLISFDRAFNSPVNDSLPVGNAGAFIAPWWQDFQPFVNTNHNVFTATLGSSPHREFVVEWRDLPLWNYYGTDLTQTVKFQVVFFEGKSDVLFNYADVYFVDYFDWSNQGYYGTVGVQVGPRSGSTYSRFQQKLNNGSAVLWTLQPDEFEVEVENPSITTFPGQQETFHTVVRSLAAFTGSVEFSCAGVGAPGNCTPAPASVIPSHEGVAVEIQVSDNLAGDRSFNVHGSANAGALQHDASATLHVIDYQFSALSTSSVSVAHPGTVGPVTFSVNALGSFAQSVTLGCNGLPVGSTCNFTPSATIVPTPGDPVNVSLTISTQWNTPANTYPITIFGNTSGLLAAHALPISLQVNNNVTFTVTPPAQALTLLPNASGNSNFVVDAHDGYVGTVSLSCSVIPAGPTCSASVPNLSSFPATVQVTVNAGSAPGQYSVVLAGDDGTVQRTGSQPLGVRGFTIDPISPLTGYTGNSRPITLTLRAAGGFSHWVQITCTANAVPGVQFCGIPTAYLNISNVQTVSGWFNVPGTVTSGTYPIYIHAEDGVTHDVAADLTFYVTIQGLQLSLGPSPSAVYPGQSASGTLNVLATGGFSTPYNVHCSLTPCTTTPGMPFTPSGGTDTFTVTAVAPNDGSSRSKFYFDPYATSTPPGFPFGVGFGPGSAFTVDVIDFSLIGPNIIAELLPAGTSQVTIGTTAYNGFSLPITISCPPSLPSGVTCSVTGNPVTPGGSAVLHFAAAANAPVGFVNGYATAAASVGQTTIVHSTLTQVAVEDFALTIYTPPATVVNGNPGQTRIVYANNGYPYSVTVGCAAPPPGVSCSFEGTTMGENTVQWVTLHTTPGTTPVGANIVQLSATSGAGTRTTPVTLNVTDFSISSSNPNPALNVGSTATVITTVKALSGFNSATSLTCAGLPVGASCSFNLNNFVPGAAGTNTTVTVNALVSLATGVYPFTINAASQGQTRTLNATLTVKDFHFTSTPTTRTVGTVPAGQTDHTTYALSAIADNGFSSAVSLTCVTPLPTGVTCSFSPSSLTPTGGGAPSTLTVTVSSTTPPGSFTLNVKGVSGAITRQLPLTLNTGGPNFTQAVTPASVTAIRGTGGSFTVVYTPLGGMSDPIAVGCSTAAAGMICSATPDAVTPGVTPGNQSVVTFTSSAGTPTANTMVTITGSALGIVRSNTVTLAVKDFSLISTAVGDLSINAGASATRGVQVKSLNGLTGSVALSCTINGSPAGVSCTVPAIVTPTATGVNVNATIATAAGAPTGGYLVTVSGTNGGQTRQYQFTAQIRDYTVIAQDSISIGAVPTGHTDVVSNFLILRTTSGFNSTVALSCVAPLPTGVTCLFNPATLVPNYPGYPSVLGLRVSSTTPNGSYPITVRSTAGTLVKNTTFTLNVGGPNFLPTITPSTAASLLGTPATYTLTLLTAGGMNTPIDVSCQGPIPGLVCSANPPQVTPGVTPGNQSVITVTGTPGVTPLAATLIVVRTESTDLNKRAGVGVTYTPRDFSLSTTTPARTVNAASSISNGVTIKALNGFSGVVTLGCSIEGAPVGVTCTLPASVSPSSTGTGIGVSVMTSAQTPAGTYIIHVNGSNSGQTRSMSFTVDVRDFSLDVSPAAQTIPGTGSGATTFSLTLTALNGFSSSAFLSCLGPLPVGLTCAFTPSSLVPSGAGAPSTLTVNVTASNAQGNHPLTVRATSGALVRQLTVTVTHGP